MCINPFMTIEIDGKAVDFKKLKYYSENFFDNQKNENIVLIPCGQCEECLKERKIDLYKRIKKEISYWEKNIFVTLTYDNEHKKNLNFRDIQLFLKRLRKKEKVRYFYVGELGENTKRPHYHMIIFNYEPNDKEETIKTKSNFEQFTSKELTRIWGNGRVTFSKMEKGLINYILKYLTKNMGENEFIISWSRKPPLGVKAETQEEWQNFKKEFEERKHLPKCYKSFYERRFGKFEKSEERLNEEKENKITKIKAITNQTGLRYQIYIKQKRGKK